MGIGMVVVQRVRILVTNDDGVEAPGIGLWPRQRHEPETT